MSHVHDQKLSEQAHAEHLIRDQLQIVTSRAEELTPDLTAEKLAKYRREIMHAAKRISALVERLTAARSCPFEKECPLMAEKKYNA